jgi:hypothetical protein
MVGKECAFITAPNFLGHNSRGGGSPPSPFGLRRGIFRACAKNGGLIALEEDGLWVEDKGEFGGEFGGYPGLLPQKEKTIKSTF